MLVWEQYVTFIFCWPHHIPLAHVAKEALVSHCIWVRCQDAKLHQRKPWDEHYAWACWPSSWKGLLIFRGAQRWISHLLKSIFLMGQGPAYQLTPCSPDQSILLQCCLTCNMEVIIFQRSVWKKYQAQCNYGVINNVVIIHFDWWEFNKGKGCPPSPIPCHKTHSQKYISVHTPKTFLGITS